MSRKNIFKISIVLPALFGLMILGGFRPARTVRGLDIDAFASLPVLHNGRIKPIDSIARNAMLVIRSKQVLRADGKKISATEWLLDLSTNLEKADAYKIFVINDPDVLGMLGRRQTQEKYYSYKSLEGDHEKINAQAKQASRVEPKLRTRFQAAIVHLDERLTLYQRLKFSLRPSQGDDSVAELAEYEIAIAEGMEAFHAHQKPGAKGFDNEALGRLGAYFQRYRFQSDVAYFRPLPPMPGQPAEAWLNMGEGLLLAMKSGVVPRDIRSYATILQAYRDGNVEAFNKEVKSFRERLNLLFANDVRMAGYETLFNRYEPFYQGMILYVVITLLIFISWIYRPSEMRETAYHLLWLAFTVHTCGLLARMWIQGRPPVTNLYSSAVFVGWGAVLLGVVMERMYRSGLASLVSGLVGFCTLIVAHHLSMTGDTMEMMQAVLDSNYWLGTHVVTITIGYSSTFLAGMLAHVYIFRAASGKLDKNTGSSLTQMTYGIVCFSLLFSFIGTILGGIWADQSWGRFWGWDPKENGALLLVLWHSVILHARLGGYIRERGLAVMAVFGNVICSLAWFGVNMLGIGLHTYGFMDKAFLWLMAFISSQFFVMALAFVPPSYFSGLWGSGKGNAKAA